MKGKKSGNTVDKVFELAKPIADSLAIDIWDIKFEKEGATWYLKVLIDKEDGINIDDCEALSRPLNDVLDEVDPIEQSYVLEVGSPGLGRELSKQAHFERYLNEEIKIKFYAQIDGSKEHICVLKGYEKEFITVILNDEERQIKHNEYSIVRLYDDKDLF